jgi:hypothetical protein
MGSLPQGSFDSTLAARIAGLQRQAAQRALRQTGQLLRILEILRLAGVNVMPYKGPAWAERLYGDVTLRSWADLDLLVTYEQVPRAREALLADGFVDAGAYNTRMVGKRRGVWDQIALSAAQQGVHVELHWEVALGMSARSLKPETLFERATTLNLLGQDVPTLSPADFILVNCLNGARDRWNSVERILGLAMEISSAPATMWPEALTVARTAGCERRVTTAVAHACRVLDVPIPTTVADALAHDATARALLRSLRPETLRAAASGGEDGQLRTLFWRFATEDSLTAAARHGAARFFTPGPEDWEGLALPPRIAWLYYPLRPVRLAVKWARKLLPARRV